MPIGEVGSLTRGGFADGEIVRIDFTEPLTDAVIHLSSTNQGGNEFSLRIVSVDANGFNFILEEWEDEDGPHPATETINWIAVREGVHELPDGRVIEAGTTTATTTASSVNLSGDHGGTPVVLTNVMSTNDDDVVDSDPLNVTSTGFDVQLQEGSLSDGVNTGETVGFIAVSTGGDGSAGYASIHGGLNASNSTFALGGTLTDGVILGETQTVNESDAGNVVLSNGASTNGSTGNITAKFDEETGDGESAHGNETVGLVGFEDGIIPCFLPDTMIETQNGPRLITDLKRGDLIATVDAGLQPLMMVADTTLSNPSPDHCPILIRANAIAPGVPSRDLCVSPQHRVLLDTWKAQLMFGEEEILVPAKALINDNTILRMGAAPTVRYIHLGLETHHVIMSNNMRTETLHAGHISKSGISESARAELFEIFPDLRTMPQSWGPVARPYLSVKEGRLLAHHA